MRKEIIIVICSAIVTSSIIGYLIFERLKNTQDCFFAKGVKAAQERPVDEKGQHLLSFFPLKGDIEACTNIGQTL